MSKNFLPEKVKCKTCGFIRPLDKLGFVSSGDLCCRKCGSKDVILLYRFSKGQQKVSNPEHDKNTILSKK